MRFPLPRPVLLLLSLSTAAFAGPLTAQTVVAPQPPAAASPKAPRRSDVSLSNGLLTVQAHNASLGQLVREIARQTGMRISGSVAEDRVFGNYGPAAPAKVLAILLDGTGSNLLIVQNASDHLTELILTPRLGAPTPPNPNEAAERDENPDDEDSPVVYTPARRGGPPRSQLPTNAPGYAPSPTPAPSAASQVGGASQDPAATQPSSTDQTIAFPQVSPGTTPATATTTPTDTTDAPVKTPQQIFQELQRLQQQTPK